MARIKFYRGVKASFKQETHADGLYFATDTHEIILNGQAYGGTDLKLNKVVKNVEVDPKDPYKLKLTYSDDSNGEIVLTHAYKSGITDKELTMPNAVGGFAKGTKVSDLEGKTNDAMWDDLLFPTVKPSYTAPSATLVLKSYSAIVEAGVAGPNLTDNFTAGYNAGAITLNGTKQNDRGGALKPGESFIFVNGEETNKTTPVKMPLGDTTFTYKASYEAGPQPKDNKGNNVDTPLPAGTVNSSAVKVNGTYPWYATTDNGTLKKQTLIAWNASAGSMQTPEFTVIAHSDSAKQSFKAPRQVKELQMYNSVSGKWEVAALSAWQESHAKEDVNGTQVDYYTYVYNGAPRASQKLKIKF